MWRKERDRITNKIINLRAKYTCRERSKIKNINYNIMQLVDSEMNGDTFSAPLKLKKISTKNMKSNELQSFYKIHIDPERFDTNFEIMSTNEQWLINLSNISKKAKVVLQLGQQFNLPNNVVIKERSIREFIKHVEHSLFRADDEVCKMVRNERIQILKSIKNCDIESAEKLYMKV